MRRIVALFLATAIPFTFAACGNRNENIQQTDNSSEMIHNSTEQTDNNTEQTDNDTEQTNSTATQKEDDTMQSDTKNEKVLDEEKLTTLLSQMRLTYHVGGMSVAVTDGEKLLYNAGFGYDSANAPDVSASPDSIYRIASISKSVTAIMVMRLYEEGILDLDTPIKNYLPWLTLSKPTAAETMTLRHLLTHTAGMPADDYMHAGSRDESTMNDVIKETLPTLKISSLPGEGKYQYSTWGYNLIGCVASTVTGKSLSQLISEYVLIPLGMDATTFDYQVASNSTHPLSQPHVVEDGELCVDGLLINTAFNAGAGLYSNAEDLCKLARFILNGGVSDSGERLLSEKTMKDMLTKHVSRPNSVYTSFYGLGFIFINYKDRFIFGHTGSYYGQNYYCSLFMDEKTGCGVVTLMNTRPTDKDIHYTIPEIIFGMLEKQ